MPQIIDLVGIRFGRLLVLERAKDNKSISVKWLCVCDCGNKKTIQSCHLRNGKIMSCGCLRNESVSNAHKKHGLYKTTEYKVWNGIRNRCLNINNKSYNRYGGAGITMNQAWADSFEQFYKDMGIRPHGFQIDRIDNSKGYYKENCRWVTPSQNCRNKSNNKLVLIDNRHMTIAEACEKLGVSRKRVYSMIKNEVNNGFSKRSI